MTIDEAFEACRHRLVVRDRSTMSALIRVPRYCPKCGEPDPHATETTMWCRRCEWTADRRGGEPSDSPDEGTLLALVAGDWSDVLDLERVHPDDAR